MNVNHSHQQFQQHHNSIKTQLRRSLLTQRQALSVASWQEKSQAICTHLQSSPFLTSAKTVLAYLSHRNEPNLQPLINANPIRWGFPRCEGEALIWHVCSTADRQTMQTGAFGIAEPRSHWPLLTAADVDLILVPAVACDHQGYRLGYGGGFYDRLFSQPDWQSIPAIGIIFAAAYLPSLPVDPWDYPLSAVCTENGLHWVRR